MDYRSLYLHFECGTYLYRCPAVLDLKADALDTLAKSQEAVSYTHLDVYKRQVQVCVCLYWGWEF